MTVTCPKCGFSQPQDRYCANCGVDMSLFRKAEVPLWKRIAQNWIFQASVLIAALLAVFIGLRLQEKLSTHDANARFRDARDTQITAMQSTPVPVAATPVMTPAPAATAATATTAAAFMATAPSATPAATPTPATTSTVAPMQIGVIYTDIPRGIFNDLVIDSRGVTTEGPFTTGIVMDYDTRIKTARGLVALDKLAPQALQLNQPSVFFKGVRDPVSGANLGLTAQVTMTASDDAGLHITVDVQRILHENGAPPGVPSPEQNFQFEFVIPKGAAGFVGGLLPHRLLDDGERNLYHASPVLNVMGSPEHTQGQSEFVIFFQAH